MTLKKRNKPNHIYAKLQIFDESGTRLIDVKQSLAKMFNNTIPAIKLKFGLK